MPHAPLELLGFLLSYAIFGALGYRLARRFRLPVDPVTWGVLALGLLASFFTRAGWLIGIGEFKMTTAWCLQGLILGTLIGLIMRAINARKATS